MAFTKGHGTGNDFVVLDDPDGALPLSPEVVAGLCDRRFGIGGDGVLRVLRSTDPRAAWFMDYWNSDGSLSEMCGNGVRVFARYLQHAGHVPAGPAPIPIATRAGLRTAYPEGGGYRVDMGAPEILGTSAATVAGVTYPGLGVSMGNPHLVCPVEDVTPLELFRPPGFDEAFYPEGVNVEFAEVVGDDHVKMRVWERGSGETLSCGTGACAVGVAHLHATDRKTGSVTVDVPGGRLVVTVDEQTCWLSGPAVLVATGEIEVEALSLV
ncbi:MAG: diaminopimelate epimerase [Hamadaea sp.]|nr:diaminopimelate epimerase [Hamadaea sp.]